MIVRIFAFFVSLAAACSTIACDATIHDPYIDVVTFMSYNTAQGKHGSVEDVASVVASQRPDFVALQESSYEEAKAIAEATSLHANKGSVGKALLSPYPMKHRSVELMESRWKRTLDIYYNDCILVANAHLAVGHEEESARPVQMEQVLETLAREEVPRKFLLGDLNAHPTWGTIRKLHSAGWIDISSEEITFAPGTEWEGKIDYIFTDVIPVDHASWVPQMDVSDHRPVVTTVFMENECE